jgi:hypothetical protein
MAGPRSIPAQTDEAKRKRRRAARDKEQHGRFLETVGEHGEVDAAEEAFETTLRVLLKR